MAKYSQVEKEDIIRAFTLLKKEGGVEVNGVEVFNVREFCKEVGISSYTIYQWFGKVLIRDKREDPHDYPKESYDNFGVENKTVKQNNKVSFGIDFWMHVARNMGIKNYRMNLNQLKLRIGNELIKSTGLVENGVRKELRLD